MVIYIKTMSSSINRVHNPIVLVDFLFAVIKCLKRSNLRAEWLILVERLRVHSIKPGKAL